MPVTTLAVHGEAIRVETEVAGARLSFVGVLELLLGARLGTGILRDSAR